jgi:small GTP-binding protein
MRRSAHVAFVGHVDHGKSTVIGRLLLDSRSLPKEKLKEIRRASAEFGSEVELAFATDYLAEEREKRITIDTAQTFLRGRRLVIIDVPGHVQFLKNMITGTSQADAAALIVDAEQGMQEQTRRHAYLLQLLGIRHFLVLVNKMDLSGYDQEVFLRHQEQIRSFLQKLRMESLAFIPVSAKFGENIARRSRAMPWYRGRPLLASLEALSRRRGPRTGPLRFPIQDAYLRGGQSLLVGRIESGRLWRGQRVQALPSGQATRVRALRVFHRDRLQELARARAGQSIGVLVEEGMRLEGGAILVSPRQPPKVVDSFRAFLYWMDDCPLDVGREFRLFCATQEVQARVRRILRRVDTSTLEIKGEDSARLEANELGEVLLETGSPLAVEEFSAHPVLCRFVIEIDGRNLGAGIVAGQDGGATAEASRPG